jgi:hypothetical protein
MRTLKINRNEAGSGLTIPHESRKGASRLNHVQIYQDQKIKVNGRRALKIIR